MIARFEFAAAVARLGFVVTVAFLLNAPLNGQSATAPTRAYDVYVAAESEDYVYLVRFDETRLETTKRIPVGNLPAEIEGPHGIFVSADGANWYVSIAHGRPFGRLDKYVTFADTLVGSVELEMFPSTVGLDGSGAFAFVANSNFDGDMVPKPVSVVYTPEMTLVAHVTTCTMPHGSRVNRAGTLQYSACMMDDEVTELDTRTFRVARRFSVAAGREGLRADTTHAAQHPAGAMPAATCSPTWAQPSPDDRYLYVACNRAKTILEIDLRTGALARKLETPVGPYNLEFTNDGVLMIVTQKAAGTVTIWDRVKGTLLAELKTGRRLAHGVAVTPDSWYAFVTSEGVGGESGSLDVVDLRTRTIVAHADIGKQAGGVAFWQLLLLNPKDGAE
jgi:DNA-binding beta-propeller fold protein YncE